MTVRAVYEIIYPSQRHHLPPTLKIIRIYMYTPLAIITFLLHGNYSIMMVLMENYSFSGQSCHF